MLIRTSEPNVPSHHSTTFIASKLSSYIKQSEKKCGAFLSAKALAAMEARTHSGTTESPLAVIGIDFDLINLPNTPSSRACSPAPLFARV